jgi:hypothetical protein
MALSERPERYDLPVKLRDSLARLRPRSDLLYTSQSCVALATGRDGFIAEDTEEGLFVHQTRLLSHHR